MPLVVAAPWAGPVGLGCAAVVIAADWYASSVENDVHGFIEQLNRAVDHGWWDRMNRRRWSSKHYRGLQRLVGGAQYHHD